MGRRLTSAITSGELFYIERVGEKPPGHGLRAMDRVGRSVSTYDLTHCSRHDVRRCRAANRSSERYGIRVDLHPHRCAWGDVARLVPAAGNHSTCRTVYFSRQPPHSANYHGRPSPANLPRLWHSDHPWRLDIQPNVVGVAFHPD